MQAWLCYDLRTFDAGRSSARITAAAIEQVAWADDKGFEAVLLPEHHGSPDGYISSPFVLGAAMAARTSRLKFMVGAVLLPLLDPCRVAEDAALLDVVSNGRLMLGAGLGYLPSEFEMFGARLEERAAAVDQKIAVLRQAFTGDSFEYRGRPARIAPRPVQEGGPPIYVCGAVAASARRAARLGDGFFPSNPELRQVYHEECRALGKEPGPIAMFLPPMFVHVAEDPERAWAVIGDHAIYEMAEYGRWAAEAAAVAAMDSPYRQLPDIEAVRASGMYAVVTPNECVELVQRAEREDLLVNFRPLMGGLDPDVAWESLELFVNKVIPAVGSDGSAKASDNTGKDR